MRGAGGLFKLPGVTGLWIRRFVSYCWRETGKVALTASTDCLSSHCLVAGPKPEASEMGADHRCGSWFGHGCAKCSVVEAPAERCWLPGDAVSDGQLSLSQK